MMALVGPNLNNCGAILVSIQHHDKLMNIVTVIAIVFTCMNNHELSFNNYIANDIVV